MIGEILCLLNNFIENFLVWTEAENVVYGPAFNVGRTSHELFESQACQCVKHRTGLFEDVADIEVSEN